MYYCYNYVHSRHWQMLAQMLIENYETPEHRDWGLILGTYNHVPVKQIIQNNETLKQKKKVVVYQTEPLVENHWFPIEKIVNNIRDADEVWDYDIQNIELLKKYGINAKYCPPKYTNSLRVVQNKENPEIDVLFYGSFTKNRTAFFDDFTNGYVFGEQTDKITHIYGNISIVWLYNIHHPQLDDYIANSKIILNMNPYYGDTRQQQTRIFYALTNHKCVMSQKSSMNYFGDNIIEFTDSQDFGNKVIDILYDGSWRNYPHNCKDYQKFINKEFIIS